MALNTKINVPISTPIISGQSNNNFSGEVTKIQELVSNTNRTNEDNVTWTSPTSNITYSTSSYQSLSNVYGKGETGLYNLLIYLYGEQLNTGWIVTADDWNSLIENIEENSSQIDSLQNGGTPATNSTYATKIGTSASHPAIGSATNPVYVNSNGQVTASNTTAGANNRPVYLNSGVLTAVTGALPTTYGGTGNTTGTASLVTTTADTTNTLYLLGVTSGATTTVKRNTGITMQNGVLTADVSGNASTASSAAKLTTARQLAVALGSTASVTFDGSANQNNIPVSGTLSIANGGTGKTTAADAWTALGGGSVGKLSYGSGTTTFLRNDGTWASPTGTYSLPLAKYNVLGGVKPAYTSTNAATLTTAAASNTTTPTIAAKTTTAGRYYGVEADKNGYLFVNVPWSDTNTTYSAGTGISLSGTAFSNSGVRAVSISGNNLRVNTNGTNADLTIPYATSAGSATTATSATSATTATTATKLGSSTVGGTAKPIYLDSGTPKAISDTKGSATNPVYLNGGTITACTYSLSSTVNSGTANKLAYYSGTNAIDDYTASIGSGTKPMYLNAGVPTASSSTVGGSSQIMYMSSGTLTAGMTIRSGTTAPASSLGSNGDIYILYS